MLKKLIAGFVLTTLIFTASTIGALAANEDVSSEKKDYGGYFEAYMKFLKENFKDDVAEKDIVEGAFKGAMTSLDKYCEYFTPKEAEEFINGIEGNYSGIGIYIKKEDDGRVFVEKVFEQTPAMKAGILDGDSIIEIDGVSVFEEDADAVAERIKGKVGSSVKLKILRGKKIIDVTAIREDVVVNPVSSRIVGDVGYVKLDIFNLQADSEIKKALAKLDEAGIKKIVLDLRNNPGGELMQAVNIAKNFVPKGVITKVRYKANPSENYDYYSDLQTIKYKLAVLVNKGSASASEILAGAIQDTFAGKLVGVVTYGKSRVQKTFPILSLEEFQKQKNEKGNNTVDGSSVELSTYGGNETAAYSGIAKVTIGEYLTPKGRKIDKKGIEPDYSVELKESDKLNSLATIIDLKLKQKYDPGFEGTEIMMVERILSLAGYEVDEPDSYYDDKTKNAVIKFQLDMGLCPYGRIDFATQKKLNIVFEDLLVKNDLQFAKALEILK